MKVVTAMQFKGGAGKTVCNMALASAAASHGAVVTLIDTDQNLPLSKWHKAGEETGYWSDRVSVIAHLEFEALQDAINELDDAGKTDYVFVDSKGGRGKFLDGLCQIVDTIIIPCRPEKVDLDAGVETLSYTKALTEAVGDIAPVRFLITGVKPDRQLSVDMRDYLDAMESLPKYTVRLRERIAYKNMQSRGLLNEITVQMAANPNALERGQSRQYHDALCEANQLLEELESLIASHESEDAA